MAVQTQSSFILPDKFDTTIKPSYETQKTMSLPTTPSTPISPIPEPYEIKPVTEEDTNRILEHLRQFFFRDEPLNVAVGLIESEDGTCIELEKYSVECIKEHMSLMAVTQSEKIIGVCINGTLERKNPEISKDCGNPKFAKILRLLRELDTKGDVFGKYPTVDKILTVKILSVDVAWRGKGIAKELMDKTRDMARETNHGLMRVDCSSYFSARAIARLGFDCIYTLKYTDYKENGESTICPADPHKEAKIYVQRILNFPNNYQI